MVRARGRSRSIEKIAASHPSCMAASIDFQPYLESICHHYAEWWELYTLTDIEGKNVDRTNRAKQPTPFDFELLAQSVKKEPDALQQEKTEKLEWRPVLEVIQKSLAEAKHVLLIGRPGSGKSTALARLLLDEAQQNQRAFTSVITSQGQQRLEERHSILEEERNLRNQKLTQLRKANAIETGAAIQFQLKQQIQDEESALKALDVELASIEQALGDVSSTPQNAAQADSKGRFRIPVLVELRYYKTSVLELIQAFFRRHNLFLEIHQIEALLSDNQLLLLIDGLNELSSDAARQEIVKLRDYRKVPMVFTTRDLSLGGDFGIEKQWEMLPLTESQMQEFIRSHLSPEQADVMWRQLQDRTRKFAETPLLLWMLCGVFAAGEEIPRNLGEVFRIFTRTYENSSIRKHEVAALKGDIQPLSDRSLWFPALKHLAYTMMQGETPVDFRTVISKEEATRELQTLFSREPHSDKAARDCLDDLLKYHLLQNRAADEIEFHHQLLQEYYVAEWLLQRLPDFSDEQLKYYFLNYLKWTEPLALMLALVEREAQAIRVVSLALKVDWHLGAKLAGQVRQEFQAKTVGLVKALEVPEWFKVELLGETRSDQSIPPLCQVLEHSYPRVWIDVFSALSKIGSEAAVAVLLEALEAPEIEVCRDAISALEGINPKATITVLSQALEDSNFPILGGLGVASLLGTIGAEAGIIDSEAAITILLRTLKHLDLSVCLRGAYGLYRFIDRLDDPTNLFQTLEHLHSKDVSQTDSQSFTATPFNDWNPDLYRAVVLGLMWDYAEKQNFPSVTFVTQIIDWALALIRNLFPVFENHMMEWERISIQEEFSELDSSMRLSMALVLEGTRLEVAISILLQATKASRHPVHSSTVFIMQDIKSEEIIVALEQAIENPDASRRKNAAIELNNITEIAVPALSQTLERPDLYIRWKLSLSFEYVSSTAIIDALDQLSNDQNSSVRRKAEFVLRRILRAVDVWDDTCFEEATTVLLQAIKYQLDCSGETSISLKDGLYQVLIDADFNLQQARTTQLHPILEGSVEALVNIGSEAAIIALYKALDFLSLKKGSHLDEYIFAKKFKDIEGKVVSKLLPRLVSLSSTRRKLGVITAIYNIQAQCKFYNYDIAQSSPPPLMNSEKFSANGSLTYIFNAPVGNVANTVHGNQMTNQ